MKVLLYTEAINIIKNSGVAKALSHQRDALERNGIEYTLNPHDSFDIAHINTVWPKSYLLARRAHKQGKRVIYHAHSTEEDFRNSFIFSNALSHAFKKWLIRCYSLGDCLITPTPYSKSLLEGYGLKQPIFAVSNGIQLDFFKRDEQKGAEFRARLGFTPEDKIVMAVGLYIERKGILDFVELAKRMPEYKFIWFGYTPLYSVPSKVRKAIRTKLPNLFFPGYVDSTVLRTAYWGADLFLFPTYEETEGIVLLEALAARQNVLIRDIPIYQGWLQDGVNVYKAGGLTQFEDRIRKILEHQCPDLTESGYQIALERDIRNIGVQLKEIYETVYDQGSGK